MKPQTWSTKRYFMQKVTHHDVQASSQTAVFPITRFQATLLCLIQTNETASPHIADPIFSEQISVNLDRLATRTNPQRLRKT